MQLYLALIVFLFSNFSSAQAQLATCNEADVLQSNITESINEFGVLDVCSRWIDETKEYSFFGGALPCFCGVGYGGYKSVVTSAVRTWETVRHPIITAKNIYNFGKNIKENYFKITDYLENKFEAYKGLSYQEKKALNCSIITGVFFYGWAIPKATAAAYRALKSGAIAIANLFPVKHLGSQAAKLDDVAALGVRANEISAAEAVSLKLPDGTSVTKYVVKSAAGDITQSRFSGLTNATDIKGLILHETGAQKVITLGGYSGSGYENSVKMLESVAKELSAIPVAERANYVVNIGATSDGIGVAYKLAKEMGFKTTGVVSSQGNSVMTLAQTRYVDVVFSVPDAKWGGFVIDGVKHGTIADLTPTSQVMVKISDKMVYVGGNEASAAELFVGKQVGVSTKFIPAEMNHAVALQKWQAQVDMMLKINPNATLPPRPTDFSGAAQKLLQQ